MVEESSEDTDETSGSSFTEEQLGSFFTPSFVSNEAARELEKIRLRMNSNFLRIQALAPYLAGLYTSDRQRHLAEAQLFRLRMEQDELYARSCGITDMIGELQKPVTITHT